MIKQAIYLLFIFLFLSVNSCSKDHGRNNGMADSDRDAYWSHPKKSFEKRRQLYLDYSAARPVTSNKAPFPQIARLELDLPIDEEIIKNSIDEIYLQQGGNNFTLGGLIRMKYLYGDGQGISQELKERINKCLLDFKYWWDEPGRDKRVYHTENHQIVFHSAELLAGQMFKDSIFSNDGKSGQEHMQHATLLLERWMDFRVRFGFSEWLSNTYFDADLSGLLNLYDFAEDSIIRERARVMKIIR